MFNTVRRSIQILVLVGLTALGVAPAAAFNGGAPELPEQCWSVNVDAGHKLAFHVYAKGVQVYKWNGSAWAFEEPRAALFAEENFFGEIGTHFRGPNWQSKSGSKVKASAVPGALCTPDPTAIAWIKLAADETSGPGIFKNVTFIQRVNTKGGLRPTEPGTLGEIREIEYTAEYYFYRAENPNGN
jgi:hypothetical protein